jgi:microcystin-dependent protein
VTSTPDRKARTTAIAIALFVLIFTALHTPWSRATSFLYPVTQPVKVFTGADGKPLNGGYIYFGVANQNPETNPVTMYWDVAGTIPAAQPLRTVSGYISRNGVSPANIYATGDFSITIKDSKGALVITSPMSADLQLAQAITGIGTAAAIPIADAGGYYTTDNVEAALQQIASPGYITQTNLAAALQALLVPTGSEFQYIGTTPRRATFWNLGGLSDGSSVATERANADTSALYTLLWNSTDNTRMHIQDSAGTPTTRGASASNDFAAHKRLPLPDARNRVHAGVDYDNGAGLASRITAATNFDGSINANSGGSQNHTLITAELAAHNHTITATNAAHSHTISITDPPHSHSFGYGGNVTVSNGTGGPLAVCGQSGGTTGASTTGVTASSDSQTPAITASSANTGSGTAHTVLQPTIVSYVIIKL